jgi:acetylglutamate kinase
VTVDATELARVAAYAEAGAAEAGEAGRAGAAGRAEAGAAGSDVAGARVAGGETTSGGGALSARARADMLIEVLPYIQRFRGAIIVIKYGGNALAGSPSDHAADPNDGGGEAAALASFASDVVLMRSVGIRPVVVHGGGPQIGQLMARLGKVPEFRQGLRVTDAETLDIARMVLVGKVNPELVSAINVHGPLAVGLSGADSRLITAVPRDAELGYVGDVGEVNPTLLRQLLNEDLIPVVATIGADKAGHAYNINADTAAGAIAEALSAEKLIYLTDIEGLRSDVSDPASLISSLGADQLEAMVETGVVGGGMIPKVAACVAAVRGGVGYAHILDGRVPHALLLEIFTDGGVGTMVTPFSE